VPHEEVGLRFRARDPESLGEMVEWVLNDPGLRDRLVAEGFEHIRDFDWADVAERTSEVYSELVPARQAN
jgi:glycogen(starch) synthase